MTTVGTPRRITSPGREGVRCQFPSPETLNARMFCSEFTQNSILAGGVTNPANFSVVQVNKKLGVTDGNSSIYRRYANIGNAIL